MPLSWSVAMVCSLRPSEPKASQHTRDRSTPCCAASSATRRSASTSLRWLISSVSWRARTPCPSRLRAKRRMSAATRRSVSTSGAARIAVLTCLSDRRCSANRSRSDRMPTTRAPGSSASVTGTCRTPWRDISSAASCAVWRVDSTCTGALITSPMGRCRDKPGSVTRPRMSCRVRIPRAAPLVSSSTSTEPMRRSCMACSASANGVAAPTP